MNSYVLLSSETECKDLSRALWRLRRPEPVAEAAGDQTLYLFGWHKHPTLNQWALRFDEQYQYPRHPDVPMMLTAPGDPYGSQALMQSLFLPIAADGANSLQALLAYILANDVIDTGEILPLVDPALVKTQAQMEAAGWFPTQVVP
jgi:hypothetical protein